MTEQMRVNIFRHLGAYFTSHFSILSYNAPDICLGHSLFAVAANRKKQMLFGKLRFMGMKF